MKKPLTQPEIDLLTRLDSDSNHTVLVEFNILEGLRSKKLVTCTAEGGWLITTKGSRALRAHLKPLS
jgi:uncharacterized protein YjhX (UPF0386 family)